MFLYVKHWNRIGYKAKKNQNVIYFTYYYY